MASGSGPCPRGPTGCAETLPAASATGVIRAARVPACGCCDLQLVGIAAEENDQGAGKAGGEPQSADQVGPFEADHIDHGQP